MKNLRLLSLALLAFPCSHAFSEPVLARVLEISGSVSGAAHNGGALEKGANLGAGSANTTGPASQISLTPFPGAIVTYAAESQASIQQIDLDRAAGEVTRAATFRLEKGTLFFAIDKVNWKTTTFEVLVPDGKVAAKAPKPPKTATAGVVVVRKGRHYIAAEAGNLTFTGPNGAAIPLKGGTVLSSNGEGYAVVDLTSGRVASYDFRGGVLGLHMATAAELQASTEIYASATDMTEALIASGSVSANIAEDISQTLVMVNEKLVALGADPVNSVPVAGLSGGTAAGSLPALSGAPGASGANPANVSGQVNSSEN